MNTPIYNFSAGPAVLPKAVLQTAANEMLNWHGSGMSVMEMSHRGAEFTEIHNDASARLKRLLQVPDNYQILFMQGGAIAQNALVPMNMLGLTSDGRAPNIDFVNTGIWSTKSIREAQKYAHVNVAASSEINQFRSIPEFSTWQISKDPCYLHICSNETIGGVEYFFEPDLGDTALVADMSSNILSRPIDISRYGVIYAGAQKNIGPAGLTIVIVREDLIGRALPHCPSAFDWKIVSENHSLYNTPPTYAIYIAGLVFQWLEAQATENLSALEVIEQKNIQKAQLLYDTLDSSDFYHNSVDRVCRSRMNVPFHLKVDKLNEIFLKEAKANGLLQLKGHKAVGGMRASIYNAMPLEGVQALVDFLKSFEKRYG